MNHAYLEGREYMKIKNLRVFVDAMEKPFANSTQVLDIAFGRIAAGIYFGLCFLQVQ